MALEQEEELFQTIKADLLATAPGQYVMIRGTEMIGVYPTYEDALADATAREFTINTYLIKKIEEEEPVEII